MHDRFARFSDPCVLLGGLYALFATGIVDDVRWIRLVNLAPVTGSCSLARHSGPLPASSSVDRSPLSLGGRCDPVRLIPASCLQ